MSDIILQSKWICEGIMNGRVRKFEFFFLREYDQVAYANLSITNAIAIAFNYQAYLIIIPVATFLTESMTKPLWLYLVVDSVKFSVEAILFHRLAVSSDKHNQFISLFNSRLGGSKAYLRSLHYTITWDSPRSELSSAAALGEHHRLFSMKIRRLYTLLGEWNAAELKEVRVDVLHSTNEEGPGYQGDCPYLCLESEVFQHLKPIPHVEDLFFYADGAHLWPGSLMQLIKLLSMLRRLSTMMHDLERKGRTLRKKARHCTSLPSKSTSWSLIFLFYYWPINFPSSHRQSKT